MTHKYKSNYDKFPLVQISENEAIISGWEEIISEITEMITEKQVVVGYYFANPCRAILTTPEIQVDESQSLDKKPVSIKLLPWLPLADEEKLSLIHI